MPGPPPKDPAQRRRRNKTSTKLQLPAEGRKGKTPKWPLVKVSESQHKAEQKLWNELWKLPQATAWEQLGYLHEVALYVRFQIKAESGSLKYASEARMRSDRLGLTPDSMRRLQWEIVEDELGEMREEKEKPKSARRLRAVDPANN